MRMTKIKTRKNKTKNPCRIEKEKEPDLQGNGRRKIPPDNPPNFTQKQIDPEVDNWKNHVKCHIFQHKFITDEYLETSLQFA